MRSLPRSAESAADPSNRTADVLRVVVDPNVLVSAAIAGGNPQRVVDLAAAGLIRLVASPLLLDELRTVLAREKFLRWRTREELERFVTDIDQLIEPAPDPSEIAAVSRDPDDNYLIALADQSDADALCSGDLDLQEDVGVVVLTPAELIRAVLER